MPQQGIWHNQLDSPSRWDALWCSLMWCKIMNFTYDQIFRSPCISHCLLGIPGHHSWLPRPLCFCCGGVGLEVKHFWKKPWSRASLNCCHEQGTSESFCKLDDSPFRFLTPCHYYSYYYNNPLQVLIAPGELDDSWRPCSSFELWASDKAWPMGQRVTVRPAGAGMGTQALGW